MRIRKIVALAMLAILALPSMTMAMGDDEPTDDGTGLACAIERARIYLDKVRTLADKLAIEYEDNEIIQGYLNEIYDLLDHDGEEDPEILFKMGTRGEATAKLSEVISHSGTHSAHLETTGTPGDGDEARIVIPMSEGFTLGDLETLSWWEYLVTGYPPHVDIYLELGEHDDSLNFEYAYNDVAQRYPGDGMPYGALMDDWYETFSDDGKGPAKVDDDTLAWPNSGSPGPPGSIELHTLAEWKGGITYTTDFTRTIDADSIVTKLEIEVDNWVVQTEAYVDDIEIDGVTHDFEEEPEGLGAEDFLDRASAYLDEGDFNSAARSLASARNILGRVKGLLTSVVKAHKAIRTERFMEQVRRRIARARAHSLMGRGRGRKGKP